MTIYHLNPVSGNAKTGPIAVSTTSADTCPDSCGFKAKGCYAAYGPSAMHWKKVNNGERGADVMTFAKALRGLPKNSLFRHNQAGDLPGLNETVDGLALRAIGDACLDRRLVAWTYTHKRDYQTIVANRGGMTVNLSADNLQDADSLAGKGLPVVVVLSSDFEEKKATKTPAGRLVVVCPAARKGLDVTCQSCGNGSPLCARADRDYIVGFPAHGTAKKTVNLIATRSV